MVKMPIIKIKEKANRENKDCSIDLSLAQLMLENSPIAVMRFTYDGSIVFVNAMGCRAF